MVDLLMVGHLVDGSVDPLMEGRLVDGLVDPLMEGHLVDHLADHLVDHLADCHSKRILLMVTEEAFFYHLLVLEAHFLE
jgi:hypothetical protein